MKREKIEKFLKLSKNYPTFDVRSPAEYQKGHIPMAFNLAILDNEERAEVGTLYEQQSPQQAYLKALERVGPKLHLFARKAIEKSVDRRVLLYCWRGGKRSESMAWLFDLLGLKTVVLEGGYRAFRAYVRSFFEKNFPFIIIGGDTGAGKTEILKMLADRGEQVLDLEALASHKGSVFGSIMSKQPHYEFFEIELFRTLSAFNLKRPIFVEDESRHLGKLLIPQALYFQMTEAPVLFIERTLENRISRLKRDYKGIDPKEVVVGVNKIKKRLGGLRTQKVLSFLEKGDLDGVVRELLYYYDKAYRKMREKRRGEIFYLRDDNNARIIEGILKQIYKKELK